MPENQPDSVATTVASPPQKTAREKTMDVSQINSLANIDVTQELSQAEMAVIAQANEHATAESDSVATPAAPLAETPTTEIKTEPTNIAEKKAEEVKKETGTITSIVGKYTSNDKETANLAKDVILVQEHLVRLEILNEEDFTAEKPTGTGEVSKDKIPKTIDAIWEFQDNVMGWSPDGFCRPGKSTIKNLVSMKLEEKAAKMLETQKKKEAKAAKEAAAKAEEEKQKAIAAQQAKEEAKAKEKEEKAKAKEAERIEKIKNESTSYINVLKLTGFMSFSELGTFLKDYALYNPKFVIRAYHIHTGYATSDNLTVRILKSMSNSEISRIPENLDAYFYDTMDWGWTTDEEYELMAKLKKGKSKEEGKEEEKDAKEAKDSKKSKSAKTDLNKAREIFNYGIVESVGLNGENKADDVKKVAKALKDLGYEVDDENIDDGTYTTKLETAIGKYQKDALKSKKPNKLISANGYAAHHLFPYSSGLTSMYGKGTNKLNKYLDKEDSKLIRLDRIITYNKDKTSSTSSFDETKNLSREDYDKSIDKIAQKVGVKEDSDEAKALDIVDKAVQDDDYYNELTSNVTAQLNLSNRSIGPHTVNPILEYRLGRYHKILVALGLFRGNMIGGACREEATAHKWSIYHSWKTGEQSATIKSNLIQMYNKELKPNNTVCVDSNGTVSDLDGNIWAKKEHFKLDESGKATGLKSTWDTYMDTVSQSRVTKNKDGTIKKDWRLEHAAEGYIYDDDRRLPMPISSGHSRSKHITGDAIDINSGNFKNRNDAIHDLIALKFGIIRPVGGEQWHFEITNVEFSKEEKKLLN